MVSTLDTLSLNIQQCVVDCFNDFAMHASFSKLIDSSFICRCRGRCAAGSYKEVTLTRLASCDSRGNKEDGTCDCRGSGGDTDQEVVTAEYWIADFSYTVPFKKRLTFDELLKGGGWTPWGTVFQDG
ncbi:hypothetical protein TRIUR3_00517 [Triticum urartu]|uniref:Uncharacterized protein n=1 Tax=Triticum urartu TaxID=4572 RepID=M8A6C7_TRIUA|nr:hypothetical protein TRIUR3_00517 [Triticum urartu]